jgi:hypothetical protein
MNEPKKSEKLEVVREELIVDSDELQLLDECNREWVDAWKAAAEQMTGLELHVAEEPIRKK